MLIHRFFFARIVKMRWKSRRRTKRFYLRCRFSGKRGELRGGLEAWMKEYIKNHDFIHNMYVINQLLHEVVGTGDSRKVRTYLVDRISTAERHEGNVVWDSGYDTASMMAFEKL